MRDNRNSNNGEDNNNNNISNNDGAYNHNDNTNDNNINTNSEDNGSIIRRFWAWRHKNRIVINGNYGNDDCNINSNGNTLLLLLSPSPSFFYIKVNERMLFNKKIKVQGSGCDLLREGWWQGTKKFSFFTELLWDHFHSEAMWPQCLRCFHCYGYWHTANFCLQK